MKFKKWGQRILATAVSAGIGFGLLSCAQSNTVDYLYLLSTRNNPGQINVYDVDSQSGALSQIPDSPYSTLGRDPVGIAMAPNGKTVYVIDQIDNVVQPYGIGTDAKLYALGQSQVNTPGSEPVAIGINQAGTFLFVVDIYQPGFSTNNPGAGAVVVYPITNGILGTPVSQPLSATQSVSYYPIGNAPTAINVVANGSNPANNASGTGDYIYLTDQLTAPQAGCTTGQGAVRGFHVDGSGVLTPVTGSPFCAGVAPSALASRPAGDFLYMTDSTQNQILGYKIDSDGSLSPFASGPIAVGSFPDALTFEATGQFLYVANRNSNNIQSFSIAQGTGVPVPTGTYATQAYPQCIIVEPNLNRFLYTADFQGAGSTGYEINPSTGTLTGTGNSPYGGSGQATCLAATVHNKAGRG